MRVRISGMLRRLFKTAADLRRYLRDGGVTYVNVAQIAHGGILRGKSALVTGGSRGIGLAIAKKYLSEGAAVIITGRNADKLKAASEEIHHPDLKTMIWDVSDVGRMEEMLADAVTLAGGNVDILVNNAGIYSREGFLKVTERTWDAVFSINAKGLYFLSQAMSKHWIERKKGGKILNVASSGGFLGAPAPYRMSKWSVVGLTRGLGLSLFHHGIIVNGIAPGMTSSEMLGIDASVNAYVPYYPPSYRVALPEEIAELAVFLASDAANYIVGQTIICDGGYSLKN